MHHSAPREVAPTPLDRAIRDAGMTDARAQFDALRTLNRAAYAAAGGLPYDHPLAARLRAIALETDQMVDGFDTGVAA